MQDIKLQKESIMAEDALSSGKFVKLKNKWRRLAKAVIFVLIIAILMGKLGEVFAYKHDSYEANNYYSFDYLYDLPKDSLDVVYLGTSQFHLGIAPLEIWNEYGITGSSFNVASCRAWTAYYMLEEILNYQNPKVVVLDAAVLRNSGSNIIANRRAIGQFKFSLRKLKALYNCLELEGGTIDEIINTSFEFFAYHDKWDSLTREDFTDDVSSMVYQKGYWMTTDCTPYSEMNHEKDQKMEITQILGEKTIAYMAKIQDLCNKKGISLMITKLPSDMWNQTYSEMVGDWAEENQIPFLDMTQKKVLKAMDFDEEISYFDNNHLNHIGAETVSSYLGNYLVENYVFDSVSQKNAEEWDADYRKYEDYRTVRLMEVSKNLCEFIELAKNPDYIVCFSIKDEATAGLTDQEIEELKSLGIDTGFVQNYRGSLVAVVDNGTTVEQSYGDDAQSCTYHPYENCEINLVSKGYDIGNTSSIQINGKEYSKNSRGLNIVVYDKKTNEVISSNVFDTNLPEDERN